MDKSKKMVAFGIGVVAIGGIAWYIMKKEKADKDQLAQQRSGMPDFDSSQNNPSQLPQLDKPSYNMNIGITNGKGLGEFKWFGVKSSDRKKFGASSEIGTQAMINGTMPCTINNFWVDSNGEKGAFKCEELEDGMYEIPGGSRLEY
tara:strand:+ start:238 stop:675 length:438 start_codon:yes stop_codon:yes gene_type:complete